MERYDEYKPTGVEWMPEIPASWAVKKLKTFIEDLESGVSVNSLDEPVAGAEIGILKTSCVYNYRFEQVENKKVVAEEVDRVRVPVKGDTLIISRMNTPELVGASGYVEADIPNLFLPDRLWQTVFRKDISFSCFPKWLSYIFISAPFRMLITSLATGTSPSMKNISKEEVLNIQVGFPKYKEQIAIARFLDDKTAQIDQLITQKQQMLELLWEERAALINHAVTKGLDWGAAMCDSGLEWLGEVPAHWEVKRLKNICRLQGRVGFKGYQVSDLVGPGEGALTLGGKHIRGNIIDISSPDYISWEKYYESPEIMVETGDLIVAQRGTLGKVAYVKEPVGAATINPSLILLKDVSVDNEFLYWYLRSNYILKIIDMLNTSTAVPMISQAQFSEFRVLVPPAAEQRKIVTYIELKEASAAETVAAINDEIALLQEYRAALIAEAVTGQIDVRDYEPVAQEILL